MIRFDIEFMCFLQNLSKCEHLMDRRFSWSKTELAGFNDIAQIWSQSVTKNDGKYCVRCAKNADDSRV